MKKIVDALNDLAELKFARSEIALPFEFQIHDVESIRDTACAEYDQQIATIEREIKVAVVELESSVKGDSLHAVYSKPRVTWDSKGLNGFAVAHPEIEAFRKIGKPSVSIRVRK